VRVTLGRTTTTATLAKIDPDNGLAEDEGAGTLEFLTASVRRQFSFGTLQTVLSKADARDDDTGLPTPEAPRTIFDALATLDRLPVACMCAASTSMWATKLARRWQSRSPGPIRGCPGGRNTPCRGARVSQWPIGTGSERHVGARLHGSDHRDLRSRLQVGDPPPACAAGMDESQTTSIAEQPSGALVSACLLGGGSISCDLARKVAPPYAIAGLQHRHSSGF